MKLIYFISFALAFFTSFVCTFLVARIAVRRQVLDHPDEERKFHKAATPALGGLAVFTSFFLVTLFIGIFGEYLLSGNIPLRNLLGIWAGGIILIIGGYLDDKYRLPPKYSILFPVLATMTAISSGITAFSVHNPLTGNVVFLDNALLFGIPIVSGLIVFVWTMVMTYTNKLLDGMDGLTTGVSAIGGLVLFGLSLSDQVMQPQTALIAITFVGSLM